MSLIVKTRRLPNYLSNEDITEMWQVIAIPETPQLDIDEEAVSIGDVPPGAAELVFARRAGSSVAEVRWAAGEIGARQFLELRQILKSKFPWATHITSQRVSGARAPGLAAAPYQVSKLKEQYRMHECPVCGKTLWHPCPSWDRAKLDIYSCDAMKEHLDSDSRHREWTKWKLALDAGIG